MLRMHNQTISGSTNISHHLGAEEYADACSPRMPAPRSIAQAAPWSRRHKAAVEDRLAEAGNALPRHHLPQRPLEAFTALRRSSPWIWRMREP
jgi:hypothetical protein